MVKKTPTSLWWSKSSRHLRAMPSIPWRKCTSCPSSRRFWLWFRSSTPAAKQTTWRQRPWRIFITTHCIQFQEPNPDRATLCSDWKRVPGHRWSLQQIWSVASGNTDHQLLQSIFQNHLASAPKRLQKMMLSSNVIILPWCTEKVLRYT